MGTGVSTAATGPWAFAALCFGAGWMLHAATTRDGGVGGSTAVLTQSVRREVPADLVDRRFRARPAAAPAEASPGVGAGAGGGKQEAAAAVIPPVQHQRGEPKDCDAWGCTCQGLSDTYGTRHMRWERAARVASAKHFWIANQCVTAPRAAAGAAARHDLPAVSLAVLACGRADLVASTVGTFERHNTYPIAARYILDCNNSDAVMAAALEHADFEAVRAPLPLPTSQRGRERNIQANLQALYSAVKTPYIYLTEGDWNTTQPGFLERAVAVLESPASADVSQVVASRRDEVPSVVGDVARGAHGGLRTVTDGAPFVWSYVRCPLVPSGFHHPMGSWTNNPHLASIKTYQATIRDFRRFPVEWQLSLKAFRPHGNSSKCTHATARLGPPERGPADGGPDEYAVHTGGGRHVKLWKDS